MSLIDPVVSEEKMFENVDNTHTYIPNYKWTTEAYLYYKLTNEHKGSGELKIQFWTSKQIAVLTIQKIEQFGFYYTVILPEEADITTNPGAV